eukprot:jgi/Mesvir1/16402/Mv25728-RA.1
MGATASIGPSIVLGVGCPGWACAESLFSGVAPTGLPVACCPSPWQGSLTRSTRTPAVLGCATPCGGISPAMPCVGA